MDKKEANQEIINTAKKESQQNRDKPLTSFTPLNENRHNDSRTNPVIMSRQNSAFKNLKNEIRTESLNIYQNGTPRKSFISENFNSIISPIRENHYVETPFKCVNYDISSPENLRFNSPMNGK